MKPYDDLTDEEVLALDQQALDTYVMLACVSAGIALPRPEPLPPEKPTAKPDLPTYTVGDLRFTDPDEAASVAAVVNSTPSRVVTNYLSGPGYQRSVAPPDAEVTVGTERLWSKAAWAQHGAEVNAYDARRREYDKDRGEWEKERRAREAVVSSIMDRRERVERAMYLRERWAREEQRYLGLGLEPEQARKALLLAHPDAEGFLTPVDGLLPLDGAE